MQDIAVMPSVITLPGVSDMQLDATKASGMICRSSFKVKYAYKGLKRGFFHKLWVEWCLNIAFFSQTEGFILINFDLSDLNCCMDRVSMADA